MEKFSEKKDKRLSERLLVLDAARGLAVIGMYVQHFALNRANSFVSGNTMILFMLCSGISYTLKNRKMFERGEPEVNFRAGMLARTVFLDFAGYVLILLNGPFAVVLPAYAMLFLLALPWKDQKTSVLMWSAAGLFVTAPPLMILGLSLFSGAPVLGDIAGGPLSALAWLPVFLTGMAVGRLNLSDCRTAGRLAFTGAAILIPVKAFSVFVLPGIRASVETMLSRMPYVTPDPYAVWPRNTEPVPWHLLFMDMPQGGSMFELLIGTGGSLVLFGFLLWAQKRFSYLYRLPAQAGRCALTLYAVQFFLAWGLALLGIEVTALDIGSKFLGDFAVAVFVLLFAVLLSRLPAAPLEAALRKWEGLFSAQRPLSSDSVRTEENRPQPFDKNTKMR